MTIILEPSTEQQVIQRAAQLGQQPQEYLRDVIADALGNTRTREKVEPIVRTPAESREWGPYYEDWKPFLDAVARVEPNDFFADGRCQPPNQPFSVAMEEWINAEDA